MLSTFMKFPLIGKVIMAIQTLCVVVNLPFAFQGSGANIVAALFCSVMWAVCWTMWSDVVEDEERYR